MANALVEEEAVRTGSILLDIPGVEFGHRDGQCTFISILEKHELKDPALLGLGRTVNTAYTDQSHSDPCDVGLETIAKGFSLMHPDDFDKLESQLPANKARYAFFRLRIAKEYTSLTPDTLKSIRHDY